MRDFDDRPAVPAREIGTSPCLERSVPVTAKLSKKFYETFGEDVTNELVEWFNSVDATYRADLRELNELNFARFDAKLEQRIAQLKGELLAEIGKLRGETTAAIACAQATMVKWMFRFWAPTAAGIVATGVGVVALLLRR